MNQWWTELSVINKIFLLAALPSTVILVIQIILSLFSLGGSSDIPGADMNGDGIPDADQTPDASFRILSLKGIIAFLCIGGWSGLCASIHHTTGVSIVISVVCGFAAMSSMALAFYFLSKLQQNGAVDYRNCIGKTAVVYLRIPARRKGKGKVSVLVQERLVEADAVTGDENGIPTGAQARIVSVGEDQVLCVEKV